LNGRSPLMPGVMPLLVMNTFAALFEVMDKEPSLLQVWFLFLLVGIGGFLLCRYRTWLLAVVLPIVLFLAWGHLSELRDPFVGPAIAREAGRDYFTQSYIAMALSMALPFLGMSKRRRKLR
jgi:hypothetical protein